MDTKLATSENDAQNKIAPPSINPKLESKRILIFLAVTFIITYVVEIGLIRPLITSDDTQMTATGQMLISSVMFIPALGVIITRLITKEGFRHSLLRLPRIKSNLIPYLIAWFGPALLTILGSAIYFLLFPDKFDPSFSTIAEYYKNSEVEMTTQKLQSAILIQILTAVFLGPLLNLINCFGEEWGWRGYLLPKMMGKYKMLTVLLINGIIWGLWHAPLTMLGHNYGTGYTGYPFAGISAMIIFCITMGTIFSYLTIKTNSCFLAVFAHGSLNAIASAGIYFSTDGGNPFIGPAPTGIIGGLFFIITAIIMAVLLIKREKNEAI